jgi:phage repressor protein C with HTH and peptisase S24 domain
MRTFSQIIQEIKVLKKVPDDADVARLLGLKPKTLATAKSRNSLPFEELASFCNKEDVSLDGLLGLAHKKGLLKISEEENASLYNNVKKLDVFTLAGAGTPKELTEHEPIDTIYVPISFAGHSIVPVKVRGDSMYPLIHDGAVVGVDREDRQIISGGLYAIWFPYEGAVIKRLFMGLDRVELKSENPIHPTLLIPLKELDEHFLLGRVKWIIQRI